MIPMPVHLVFHATMIWLAWKFFEFLLTIDHGVAAMWLIVGGLAAVCDICGLALRWVAEFRGRPPEEQSLRHASQGLATICLVLISFRWINGCLLCMAHARGQPLVIISIVFGIPFVFGLVRLIAGLIDLWWYPFRFLPTWIQMIKSTFGEVLLQDHLVLHRLVTSQDIINGAFSIIGIWLLCTGLVRLFVQSGLLRLVTVFAMLRIEAMRHRLAREKIHGDPGVADDSVVVSFNPHNRRA